MGVRLGNKEPNSYRRKNIDAYVGLMLKDLAAFVDNEIIFTGDGYDCSYEPSIGTQPNTCDFGIYIIKWMELWNPKSMTDDAPLMPRWDNNDLQHIRKELVMDMLFCRDNVSREVVDGVLNEPQRRLEDRGKKRHIKEPWTNLRTASLIRRAEGGVKAPRNNKK